MGPTNQLYWLAEATALLQQQQQQLQLHHNNQQQLWGTLNAAQQQLFMQFGTLSPPARVRWILGLPEMLEHMLGAVAQNQAHAFHDLLVMQFSPEERIFYFEVQRSQQQAQAHLDSQQQLFAQQQSVAAQPTPGVPQQAQPQAQPLIGIPPPQLALQRQDPTNILPAAAQQMPQASMLVGQAVQPPQPPINIQPNPAQDAAQQSIQHPPPPPTNRAQESDEQQDAPDSQKAPPLNLASRSLRPSHPSNLSSQDPPTVIHRQSSARNASRHLTIRLPHSPRQESLAPSLPTSPDERPTAPLFPGSPAQDSPLAVGQQPGHDTPSSSSNEQASHPPPFVAPQPPRTDDCPDGMEVDEEGHQIQREEEEDASFVEENEVAREEHDINELTSPASSTHEHRDEGVTNEQTVSSKRNTRAPPRKRGGTSKETVARKRKRSLDNAGQIKDLKEELKNVQSKCDNLECAARDINNKYQRLLNIRMNDEKKMAAREEEAKTAVDMVQRERNAHRLEIVELENKVNAREEKAKAMAAKLNMVEKHRDDERIAFATHVDNFKRKMKTTTGRIMKSSRRWKRRMEKVVTSYRRQKRGLARDRKTVEEKRLELDDREERLREKQEVLEEREKTMEEKETTWKTGDENLKEEKRKMEERERLMADREKKIGVWEKEKKELTAKIDDHDEEKKMVEKKKKELELKQKNMDADEKRVMADKQKISEKEKTLEEMEKKVKTREKSVKEKESKMEEKERLLDGREKKIGVWEKENADLMRQMKEEKEGRQEEKEKKEDYERQLHNLQKEMNAENKLRKEETRKKEEHEQTIEELRKQLKKTTEDHDTFVRESSERGDELKKGLVEIFKKK